MVLNHLFVYISPVVIVDNPPIRIKHFKHVQIIIRHSFLG